MNRLREVSLAPLGKPVVPPVYCRYSTWSMSTLVFTGSAVSGK